MTGSTTRRPPVAAIIYGVLIVAMGIAQLTDVTGFVDILSGYDVFGRWDGPAAAFIVAAELAAGIGVLACRVIPRPAAVAAGWLGIAIALIWASLATQAFVRGLDIPNCGCFGVHFGQRLRWWILLEDLYMFVLAWYAARGVRVSASTAITLRVGPSR